MGGVKKGSEPSRAERKAKKRKLEEAIPDVPGDNDFAEEPEVASKSEKAPKKRKREHEEADEKELVGEKKSKKEKKEKKRRKEENGDVTLDARAESEVAAEKKSEADDVAEGAQIPRKSKKERKAERKAREAAEAAASKTAVTTLTKDSESNGASISTPVNATKEEKPKKKQQKGTAATGEKDTAKSTGGKMDGKAARFIVFIGSLPYTATTQSIQKHFATVKPISVRSPMQKDDPKKSKGYAFLEFEGYDHMKTCLKLFHHSMFDDGISPPRKISVELTAGGGGNTKERKKKIQEKNQKLNEERVRRIHEEAKTKAAKSEGAIDESAIHPSRRARVPGM